MFRLLVARSARRCDLTEQIGARRRDVYASDTFVPRDGHVSWVYPKVTSIQSELIAAAPDKLDRVKFDNKSHVSLHRGANRQETIADPEAVADEMAPEWVTFSRSLDAMVSVLTGLARPPEVADLDTCLKVNSELDQLYTRFVGSNAYTNIHSTFNANCFSEDYHCLYMQYRIEDSAMRLSGNYNIASLKLLQSYSKVMLVPSPNDIADLREALSKMDLTTQENGKFLVHLVKLKCFIRHPLVEGFLKYFDRMNGDGAKTDESVSQVAKFSHNKQAISETPDCILSLMGGVKKAAGKQDCGFSMFYRTSVCLPYVTGDVELQRSLEQTMKAERSAKELYQLDTLRRVNDSFRNSLFPS